MNVDNAFMLQNVVFLQYLYENDDVKKLFKICPPMQNRQICHKSNRYERQY